MNCKNTHKQLQYYVDDELSIKKKLKIDAHLKCCTKCSLEIKELQKLKHELSALGLTASPEKDLWPQIESELNTIEGYTPGFRNRMKLLTILPAAAVLIVILAFSFMIRNTADSNSMEVDYSDLMQKIDLVEEKYEQLKPKLKNTMALYKVKYDESAEIILENLAIIDEAINEIHTAIKEKPENRQLYFVLMENNEKRMNMISNIRDLYLP